jgi:large subunit ribosomal protein L3
MENNGYTSLQLGYGEKRKTLFSKPELIHFEKKELPLFRYLKEFKGFEEDLFKVGDDISLDLFKENEFVNVTGISKGKGFAGVHKRHGFSGGRKTHGSNFHRAPGSIGQCSTPSKVFKGVRMPGRMGSDRVTVSKLKVMKIIKDKNYILVKGAIPGRNNGIVVVTKGGNS